MTKKIDKIIALLLAALMLLTLTACGKTETPAPSSTVEPANLTVSHSEEKTETAGAPAAEEKEQSVPEPTEDNISAETMATPAETTKTAPSTDADDEDLLTFELLDTPIACRTFFFQYISEDSAVFDLHSLARDLGYKEDEENEFVFSKLEQNVQISLEEKEEENSQKIFKAICYKTEKDNVLCTFERTDRFDGSLLYSVNTPDNYTLSMDQILLLTYIMENINKDNPDPLAGLYSSEYWTSGMYRFPI